jgi:hypothetical protein
MVLYPGADCIASAALVVVGVVFMVSGWFVGYLAEDARNGVKHERNRHDDRDDHDGCFQITRFVGITVGCRLRALGRLGLW